MSEALPEGWENGITFRAIGCTEPQVIGTCEVADGTEVRPGDSPVFVPVFLRQTAACSLLSQIGTVDIARDRLESTSEWGLGRLLATGLGTDNPSFADAETVHTGGADDPSLEIVSAVSCLEQAVADFGFGAEAVLHAPFRAAAWLRSNHLIDGDGWSPAGMRWIISPGYPVGEPENGDQTINLWATGTVWADVSEPYTLLDGTNGRPPVNWQTNLDAAFRQRLGLAAFDPCLNLTASFVVPACIGDS